MSLNNRRDVQKFRPAQPGAKPPISDGKLFDDDCLDEASRQSVMREVQGSSKPKPLTTTQQQQIDELINKGSSKAAAVVGNGTTTTPPPATYQRNTVGGMTPSQLAQMLRQEAVTTTSSDPRRASAQLSSTPTKRHTDQGVGTSSSTTTGGYVLPPSPSRRAQSGSSLSTSTTTNTTSSSAVPASSKIAPSSSAQLPVRSSKVPVQGGGVYDSSSSSAATTNNSRATHQSHTIGGGGGDGELLGVMIQRLRTIENSQRMMQLEIKEKAKKIIELEDRYASEKLARKEAEESKEALAQELSDIMEFLEEYGLSWVGKDVDEISDQGTPRQRSTSAPSSHRQQPGGGGKASGGHVLGRRQSTADDDEDEVGVHANIQQSNLPLGNGLVFDNSQHQTEEGRGRGGRSSASAVQQFRHDQHLKDGEMVDLPPGPLNSTQKPAAVATSLNSNQRTVNTSTDITPTPPPPAPEGGGDGGRRAGSNPRGFSLYEGTFDSQSTTPAADADGQKIEEPSNAAPLTPTSSTSALPPSIVAAQQQRHQQYLEEKKRAGNNNNNPTSTSATTAVSNAILNARKLKKLPFSLERFVKNCGILSDHVGEKAFMALHSGDNRGSNNNKGGNKEGGAVGASLAVGSSPLPSDNTGKPSSDGAAGRKRILQERAKVFVVIYNDGICVNGGLFRPYGWPLCDAFLNDILDGFYPYEFKDKYPDGFPVEPLDHSREYHDAHSSSSPASSGGRIHDNQSSSSSSQHKPISKEQFLKNLPSQSITKAGKIVDVQSAVRGRYGGAGGGGNGVVVGAGGTAARAFSTPQLLSTIKGDTAAAGELVRRQQESPAETTEVPEIGRRITTVQIKLPGGEKCVLHMFFRDTIANVRAEFKKAVPQMFPKRRGGGKDDLGGGVEDEGWYEFRSMFPRVECTDHTKSLQELELVPSCTLMLLRINNNQSSCGDASTTTAE